MLSTCISMSCDLARRDVYHSKKRPCTMSRLSDPLLLEVYLSQPEADKIVQIQDLPHHHYLAQTRPTERGPYELAGPQPCRDSEVADNSQHCTASTTGP